MKTRPKQGVIASQRKTNDCLDSTQRRVPGLSPTTVIFVVEGRAVAALDSLTRFAYAADGRATVRLGIEQDLFFEVVCMTREIADELALEVQRTRTA